MDLSLSLLTGQNEEAVELAIKLDGSEFKGRNIKGTFY